MEWTTDKPTEKGLYWQWDGSGITIIQITEWSHLYGDGEPQLTFILSGQVSSFDDTPTRFWKPLLIPELPTISADQAQKANV